MRIGINLIQVHRGGPKIIGAFDGQKIDGGDVIFRLLGAENGENKPDFLKRLCTHNEEFRNVLYSRYNNSNKGLIFNNMYIHLDQDVDTSIPGEIELTYRITSVITGKSDSKVLIITIEE